MKSGAKFPLNDIQLPELAARATELKRLADYDNAKEALARMRVQLDGGNLWKDPTKAKKIGREYAILEASLARLDEIEKAIKESQAMLELAEEEKDEALMSDLNQELVSLQERVKELEFHSVFNGPNDAANAFLEIKAGQGGTEAQDWAAMLLRMYSRWGEEHEFKTELLDYASGEVAGIKGASIRFIGEYAYGWLRTETGIHRLVRKSPFNAGNKRHTSFASVFVTPEINDSIDIEINPKDLRIDTYRASGAGGQHVNKTDSAVRITHNPTGLVVQCQNQRSQHQNKIAAMKQLRSKVYQLEEEKRNMERSALEEAKDEISWGRQIRSYVLDSARIKDLRTGMETSDCEKVLNGDLDSFIQATLQLNAEMANKR